MTHPTNGGGLFACLAFENAKLLPRVLPWLAIAVTMLAIVADGWLGAGGGEMPKTSWSLYAGMLDRGVVLAGFFLLVLGCLAVNEEQSSGSLRAVFLRPVGRGTYLAAKMIVLLGFALILGGVAISTSWLWTATHGGFSSVTLDLGAGLEAPVVFTADEMNAHGRRLSAAIFPGLVCAPLFGMLISILVESAGFAVVLGVLGWAALRVLASLGEEWAAWSFPAWTERPVQLLGEIAEGIKTHQTAVDDIGLLSPQWLVPLGLFLVFATSAVGLFRWREIRC